MRTWGETFVAESPGDGRPGNARGGRNEKQGAGAAAADINISVLWVRRGFAENINKYIRVGVYFAF